MNINVSLTGFDSESGIADEFKKLQILIEKFKPDHIGGIITNSNVMIFLPCKNSVISISGQYDNSYDLFPSKVLIGNSCVGNFNWHPFDGMGGFDDKEFKNEISRL